MSSFDPSSTPNKYVIDIENGAETARLIDQDRLFTRAMGGLFPELPDLSRVKQVLDIACGPGGWVQEMAFQYPHIEVLGIDINRTMIDYARALAKAQRLDNAMFAVMDVTKLLPIEDSTFDIVNARVIAGFMEPAIWPQLLGECRRVLKPGGILRLAEIERGFYSSVALHRLSALLYKALTQQGRTFSVDGEAIGIVHMLGKLLQDAGLQQIEQRPWLLDASHGSSLHYSMAKDYEAIFGLLKPYLVKSGVIEPEDYEKLYTSLLIDMLREDFRSISFGLIAWGRKPLFMNVVR